MIQSAMQLDWRGYFREFDRLHGGDPVLYRGKLLYRDGWQYSSSDYRGPEYPPPADPRRLLELRKAYWESRVAELHGAAMSLEEQKDQLRAMQAVRSAPLQQRMMRVDEESGNLVPATGSVSIAAIDADLDWAREQSRIAKEELRAVREQLERLEVGGC